MGTMTRRLSLSGSMRKINSASSPCRKVEMSVVCLKDLPRESKQLEIQSKRSLVKISVWMKSMDIFTLAQLTLVLVRASVHVDLPGWTKHSVDKLKARCEELHLQPRGTRGG